MEKFSERIYQEVESIWLSYIEHPFVKEMGEGILEERRFVNWLKQDYVYLFEYARLMAIGAYKAPNLEFMQNFAKGLYDTLFMEMDLHRKFASQYGITETELEQTEAWPMNVAYTSYMLNHAQKGGVEYTIAALLTCAWSYNFVGQKLARLSSEDNPYQAWIDTYSGEEFTELTQEMINLMDKLVEGLPENRLAELEEIIVITSRYEFQFWDMCYNSETWVC